MPTLIDGRASAAGLVDAGSTLSAYRYGRHDPTTRLVRAGRVGRFQRATLTPEGAATVEVCWRGLVPDRTDESPAGVIDGVGDRVIDRVVDVATWGPGGGWLAARVPAMLGRHDHPGHGLLAAPDACVRRAATSHPHHRMGASGDLYHELLPTVIQQRITSGEAKRQWRRLCVELGEPAPGPFAGLLLPPSPSVLARQPTWWFHPVGIERKRAETLVTIARHADRLWSWADLGAHVVAARLLALRGVGAWTVGSVLGPALGDTDAVPVGDYHVKHLVAWALAGEPRATDDRMLELLAPYAGQRGRVVRLLKMTVGGAPKFGPRQRILPMHSW